MNAHAPLLAACEPIPSGTDLRDYQAEALAMVRREVAAGRRRIVLQLPTAAGKTRIAAEICSGALAKGRRAAFTVPMLSLVNQTVERFRDEGISDIGVMQAGHELTDRFAPMQVISLQTLARRKFDPPAVMIVDEVHVRNRALEQLLERPEWADVPVIGLSATPWSRGLGKRWECLLVPTTMAELILAGWLTGYRVFAPSTPDLSDVSIRAGDYAEDQLAEVMSDVKLVADIVETWRTLGENRPTICFAVDRAHARKLEREFSEAGIASEYADAFTLPRERDAIGERLRSGETKIVCNVGIFCIGTDWPFVACLILARPTKSPILFVQQIGRGLRPYPDKRDCRVLDHAGNTLSLGFPADIHYDELDNGEGKPIAARAVSKDRQPKECPNCKRLRPAGVFKCPNCGSVPERASKIQVEEGELHELDKNRKAKAATHTDKQAFYSQLKGYALLRNKSQKWVLAQYRAKFQVWPRGLAETPTDPRPEMLSWIRSRNIAFAKLREKRRAA